jgi:Holliday junction resolvase RusA-like endonuclease
VNAPLPVEFHVDGIPVPQGSKTVFNNRAVDSNQKKLRPWRRLVEATARHHMAGAPPLDGDLTVSIEFQFTRPKTVRRLRPSVKPDVDKLIRSVFDALTDAGVWPDDARVVEVTATKVYAPTAGALIRVDHIEGEQK